MNWVDLVDLPPDATAPEGYTQHQLERSEIPALTASIARWYPNISAGSERALLQQGFYENDVELLGEEPRDTIVYVGKTEGKIISVACIKRELQRSALFGMFGAIDPKHRGARLAAFGSYVLDAQAKSMGMAMAYTYVTLKMPALQKALERGGFRPVGILPCSDRELVSPGVVKHVYEVIYAKVYATPENQLSVSEANMTAAVSALWQLVGSNE